MVQLKRSTLPTRHRLRNSTSNQPVTAREWSVLLFIVGITTYFLSSFFFSSGASEALDGGPGNVRTVKGHQVAHGRGRRVPELSDAYNALANDVIKTLDCGKALDDGFNANDYGRDVGRDNYGNGRDSGDFGPGLGDDRFGDDVRVDGQLNQWEKDRGIKNKNNNNNMLDDDGRLPDALNQRRRRLQLLDDDGGAQAAAAAAAEAAEAAAEAATGDDGRLPDTYKGDGSNEAAGDDAFGGGNNHWGGGMTDDVAPGGAEYNANPNAGGGPTNDFYWGTKPKVNGRHLLCLAAGADNLPKEAADPSAYKCDVLGTKREALLDLWESARGQQIPTNVLISALDHAFEHTQKLLDHTVNLWSPWEDDGFEYIFSEINTEKQWTHGGIRGLDSALGPHKLFVDIGSNLGLTAMAVALTYPGTAVIAVEPAPPSWVMQELNLRCNSLHPQPHISSVLSGLGPKNNGMAKMMWRPSSTTSTRTWTPKSEHKPDDIELTVHLRNMRTILAEGMPDDLPYNTPISVMNIDCEGCEYDVIPAFTDSDFDTIDIMLGEIHWGYIPSEKLPSSERARKTHERLCRHEAFARDKIECCAFPDMQVDTLVDTASTVKELAGSLCDNFEKWVEEHSLYSIPDDVGWFELSSETDY